MFNLEILNVARPLKLKMLICSDLFIFGRLAYEYIPDSEMASTTVHSMQDSEEDLLDDTSDFETDMAPEFIVPLQTVTPSVQEEPVRCERSNLKN